MLARIEARADRFLQLECRTKRVGLEVEIEFAPKGIDDSETFGPTGSVGRRYDGRLERKLASEQASEKEG